MKFSRQSRLLKPAEFKAVFKKPVRSGDGFFRILARVNGLQRHRLGMAVSKKACPGAVGRNRIKRIIRENFRNGVIGLEQGCSLDFVVLPNAEATRQDNKALSESLAAHWKRLIKRAGSEHSTALRS
jgi:ribonuclease P protein component